ncbi:MAG: alpha-hydroxy acid oxidase [Luteolibacter sp.]
MMLPPLNQIPPHVVALEDYELLARERLSPGAWAYLAGGAADGITLGENRAAFDRLRIVPRVLRDLSEASTRLTLFGQEYEHPIFIAPTAYHRLFHDQGEIATVLGAAAFQAGVIVSTQASVSLEEIAANAQSPLWFQLYIQPDRDFTLELVRRAEAAGYQALVVTVDAPISGIRNKEQRVGFHLPPGVEAVNLRGMRTLPPGDRVFGSGLLASAPTWNDVEWLCERTRLPVLVKGILSPDDARCALDHGVSGIIVSNHGGRVLDTVPATIEVLPEIVETVDQAVPVLLDGGIRRGTDIFKAISRGADAVLVGRPILYGLAAAGALGVAHVLKILRSELEATMALSGRVTLREVMER